MAFRFEFEWDELKELSNRAKHGVSFAQATSVFLDPLAATVADDNHSDSEQRWVTLGLSKAGFLIVIVHTYLELEKSTALVRVISARRATASEMRDYEEGEIYEA